MTEKNTNDKQENKKVAAETSLVKARLMICNSCPDKITMFKIVDCCGLCKCPLMSRTYFTKSFCPVQKW